MDVDDWLEHDCGPEGAMETNAADFSWSSDQARIAFVFDSIIRIFDPNTMQVIKDLDYYRAKLGPAHMAVGPCFSADDKFLAFAYARDIHIVSTENWQPVHLFRVDLDTKKDYELDIVRIDKQNEHLARMGMVPRMSLEEVRNYVVNEREARFGIDYLSWNASADKLFASNSYGWLLLDSSTGETVDCYCHDSPGPKQYKLSDNGKLLTCVDSSRITVFSFESKEVLLEKQFPPTFGSFGRWSPDETKYVFSSYNKQLMILELLSGEIRSLGQYRDNYTPHLAWSPNGHFIAVHSPEEGVEIRNAENGEILCRYRNFAKLPFVPVTKAQFEWSWDGTKIIVGRQYNEVDIWTLPPLT